jgi:2,4-dienoyl-CoA reductase-like NADH-dependent reductase (Old Yellow Enzyme family)
VEIIRSATFEGMADKDGYPTKEYKRLYETLAKNEVKTLITGFMYISNKGRAMQIGQAGMDEMGKVKAYKEITDSVHRYGSKIIAQLAHTGRQTWNTGYEVVGVSSKKSNYFNTKPHILTINEINATIEEFSDSALYAKLAGFDGVQLHAAHGYLIHQFLLPSINDRQDEYGEGTLFLERIIHRIREKCEDFPIWVKVSWGVDIENYTKDQFIDLICFLDKLKVDAIEVSYGTMDVALNIFRGKIPIKEVLKYNPIYNKKSIWWRIFGLPLEVIKIKKFTPMYNLEYAKLAKQHTNIPVIAVGGFRIGEEIHNCGMDFVSLSRPFICEVDFLVKLKENPHYVSKCTNCNRCAIMCDTKYSLRCYGRSR